MMKRASDDKKLMARKCRREREPIKSSPAEHKNPPENQIQLGSITTISCLLLFGCGALLLVGCGSVNASNTDLPWSKPANWEAPAGLGQE